MVAVCAFGDERMDLLSRVNENDWNLLGLPRKTIE